MRRFFLTLACAALVFSAGCAGQAGKSAPGAASPTGKAVASGSGRTADTAGGADADWDEVAEVKVHDPIEPVNRGIFWFNHQLYTYVAKPFSTAYKFVFPQPVRHGIRNAYDNIRFPVRFVNHTLQGRLDRSAKETGKFLVNTTAGVGGIMKPSEKIPALADLPPADTGQTFAKWGVPHGPYVVLPVLGPSSCRDAVGTAGDTALNPISWLTFVFGGAAWTTGVSAPSGTHSLPDRMDAYDLATKDAVDPYVSARTGYIQYRNAAAQR